MFMKRYLKQFFMLICIIILYQIVLFLLKTLILDNFITDRLISSSENRTMLKIDKRIRPNEAKFRRLASEIFIYSTFIDYRQTNVNEGMQTLRLLSIIRNRSIGIYCIFTTNNATRKVDAFDYEIRPIFQDQYGIYIFNCPFVETFANVAIGLKGGEMDETIRNLNVDYVINEKIKANFTYRYSICVPLFYGDRYRAEHLIEFIEMNRLFGADQIFIYANVNSLSDEVQKVFDYYDYVKEKLTVVDYRLPVDYKSVYYNGQQLVINDCLYKNTGLSRFTAFFDLDELLVPIDAASSPIPDLFEVIFSANRQLASIRVAARYFYLGDSRDAPIAHRHTMASKGTYSEYGKCIVRPELVFEQSVHHTIRLIHGRYIADRLGADNVNGGAMVAELHHYNDLYNTNDLRSIKIDRIQTNYGPRFLAVYYDVLDQLGIRYIKKSDQ